MQAVINAGERICRQFDSAFGKINVTIRCFLLSNGSDPRKTCTVRVKLN